MTNESELLREVGKHIESASVTLPFELAAKVLRWYRETSSEPLPVGWQPIEAAPKGGAWVLLWWPDITDCAIVGYHSPYGWHSAVGGGYESGDKYGHPTHWMPLPVPPDPSPQRCSWTDAGSPCIYVEGHTAPHVSEARANAVAHPANELKSEVQRTEPAGDSASELTRQIPSPRGDFGGSGPPNGPSGATGQTVDQIVARARTAHGGRWPEQLTSGVMFYEGARITRQQFEATAQRT